MLRPGRRRKLSDGTQRLPRVKTGWEKASGKGAGRKSDVAGRRMESDGEVSAAYGKRSGRKPARKQGNRCRLNPAQRRAAEATAAVTAVIAGPGTGKTKTLISRILWMLQGRKIPAGQITAVTFTKKAAAEMEERLSRAGMEGDRPGLMRGTVAGAPDPKRGRRMKRSRSELSTVSVTDCCGIWGGSSPWRTAAGCRRWRRRPERLSAGNIGQRIFAGGVSLESGTR